MSAVLPPPPIHCTVCLAPVSGLCSEFVSIVCVCMELASPGCLSSFSRCPPSSQTRRGSSSALRADLRQAVQDGDVRAVSLALASGADISQCFVRPHCSGVLQRSRRASLLMDLHASLRFRVTVTGDNYLPYVVLIRGPLLPLTGSLRPLRLASRSLPLWTSRICATSRTCHLRFVPCVCRTQLRHPCCRWGPGEGRWVGLQPTTQGSSWMRWPGKGTRLR